MSLSTDALLERIRLKSQLLKWRAITIVLGALLAYLMYGGSTDLLPGPDYIARIEITGLVDEDQTRDDIFKELAENNDVKAVLVKINTPGGTVVGGESIYNGLRNISKTKPTVALMGTLATSGGYMAALGTDRIYANQGTLTGSIGVLLQTAEVIELAKKVGIELDTIKSGPLKASPSPLERMTPEARQVMQGVIDDYYKVFINMVAESRKLPIEEVRKLADGRVYTGNQALNNKLIDEIGGQDEAIKWLREAKNVTTDNIKDIDLYRQRNNLEGVFSAITGQKSLLPKMLSLQGLLSVWVDGIM